MPDFSSASLTGLANGKQNVFLLNSGGSLSGNITGAGSTNLFNFLGGTVAGNVDGGGGAASILNFAGIGPVGVTLTGVGDVAGFDGSVSGGSPIGTEFFNITVIAGSSVGTAATSPEGRAVRGDPEAS